MRGAKSTMSKSKSTNFNGSSVPAQDEEVEWEVRPSGMLVQKRENDDDDGSGASSRGPMIKINVSNGTVQHEVFVPAQSTFGTLLFVIFLRKFSYSMSMLIFFG